ncbi:MAG: hypothetical protein QM662_03830 [Gordonia sp. (in: high G+C Gram-positive bacteria)]
MEHKPTSHLLKVACGVFMIGVAAIVALFVTPLVDGGETAPTTVYLLTMCAPLGFLLGIAAALRAGRHVPAEAGSRVDR